MPRTELPANIESKALFTLRTSSPFHIFVLIALALALRLPGLTWGLPDAEHWYSYHPDERQIAGAVYSMLEAGDWNPRFFNYPSLFIYLTYFVYLIQSGFGFTSPAAGNAPWPFLHDVMLSGRIVCALLGAFTIPAVYLIGRQLRSVKFAFLAALFMAFTPSHVQHSHFATVDVPATFFVAWSLYFAVRALLPLPNLSQGERDTPLPPGGAGGGQKALLYSAFIAGLAAATKYNAGLVLIAPLCGLWFGVFDKKFVLTISAIALAIFAFILGCPYSVFDTPTFLGDRQNQGVLYELLVHSRQGHGAVFINTGNGWLYHLAFNLPFALTAPLAIAGVLGILLLVVPRRLKSRLRASGRTSAVADVVDTEGAHEGGRSARSALSRDFNRRAWIPLVAFALLYFFTLGFSQVRFMRYLFPLVPVLCLSAAFALTMLPIKARKITAGALALLVFIGATNVLYPFLVPDPRDQAAAYLKSKITQPVTVALLNQPWFYTPPLWPQDFPPPAKVESGVSPDGRFRFVVVGLDHNKALDVSRGGLFIANEFEYREHKRIVDYHVRKRLPVVGPTSDMIVEYLAGIAGDTILPPVDIRPLKNHPPLELPGRKFVPHDFLYTNPEVWIASNGK